jgi:hypothetical protein
LAIFLICVGVIIVVVGILNNEFYSGDIIALDGFKKEKKLATWYGRAIFILGGAIFIAGGVGMLFTP